MRGTQTEEGKWHTDRQTDIQTDRQTDRRTDRKTERITIFNHVLLTSKFLVAMALATAWVLWTHSMRGTQTEEFPSRETTMASESGVAFIKAKTASTPILHEKNLSQFLDNFLGLYRSVLNSMI